MSDVAELMKRGQRGVGGRNALDEAHDIMAECYGTLGRLESERTALEAECERLRADYDNAAEDAMDAAREANRLRIELEAAQGLSREVELLGGQRERIMAARAPTCSCWRSHSVNYAKGETPPQTLEALQAAWGRDQELILDQKAEISRLKEKLNQAQQKRTAASAEGVKDE